MAGQDLIGPYLAELREMLGRRRDVDAIVAELEDHLRSGVERRTRDGLDEIAAQQESLDLVGRAGDIARELSRSQGRGLALSSRMSRAGGLAAVVSAALIVVSPVPLYAWVQVGLAGSGDVAMYWVYAVVLVASTTASLVALAGALARSGAGLGPGAVAATLVAGFGVLATALFTWGSVVTLALIWLPFAVALAWLARITRVPGLAWVQLAAWPAALASFVVLNELTGVGPTDEYGDHPWAWFVSGAVFAGLWAVGQLALGRLLLVERLVLPVAPAVRF